MKRETLTIRVADIPVEGRSLRVCEPFLQGKNPQGPFDTRHLEFEAGGPIEAELTLERVGGVLRIRGPVHFPYTLPCARSNEPVPCRFDEPLDVTLWRAGSVPSADSAEDDDEGDTESSSGADLDEWTYEGEDLDLAPILYEHIALNLPMKVLAERFRNEPEAAWSDREGAGPAGADEGRQSPFAALKDLNIKKGSGR